MMGLQLECIVLVMCSDGGGSGDALRLLTDTSSILEGSLELVVALAVNSANAELVEHLAVQSRVGHLDLNLVAGIDRTDTSRGTGEQHVTLLQGHDTRDELDKVRDVEDHVLRRALLLHLTVDRELETDVRVVGDLRGRDELAALSVCCMQEKLDLQGREISLHSPNGAEGVQSLGSGPGQSLLLRRVLHVASRHVDGEGVASDVLRSLRGRDVPTILADDNTKLNLVVGHNTLGDLNVSSGGKVGRGRLQEEEGLCRLAWMVCIK